MVTWPPTQTCQQPQNSLLSSHPAFFLFQLCVLQSEFRDADLKKICVDTLVDFAEQEIATDSIAPLLATIHQVVSI